MNLRPLGASILVVAVSVFAWSCSIPGSAQKSEMKSTGKMSMDDMMKHCKEHHQSAMKSIDQMTKVMDGAKQSNDPAKMRSALDQSQKHLAQMKEQMTMCGNMMNMMEKMHGMGGMMQGGSK